MTNDAHLNKSECKLNKKGLIQNWAIGGKAAGCYIKAVVQYLKMNVLYDKNVAHLIKSECKFHKKA